MSYHTIGAAETIYNLPLNQVLQSKDLKNSCYKVGLIGIDATAATTPTIYTTEAGAGLFYITDVIVIAQTITAHTSVASISVGITGAGYTDLLANTAQTGLTATGKYLITPVGETALAGVPASTAIVAKFNTNAVGTKETYGVFLLGFYEDFLSGQTL